MPENVLAEVSFSSQMLSKSKPRYTEAENQLIYDSWWNPQKRRELAKALGRDMSALRSQFSRLLKEKGLSNQEYYKMMSSKPSHDHPVSLYKRSREVKTTDQIIFDTFCKHQALGNPRTKACDELIQKFGDSFSPAALKLRFYRMVNKSKLQDHDLLNIGKKLLSEEHSGTLPIEHLDLPDIANDVPMTPQPAQSDPSANDLPSPSPVGDTSFFYQISSLPDTIHNLKERLAKVEDQQRRQLDLRGFIEHLLAVERDLKREDNLLEEIQRLMDDNESIRNMMEKDKERLKKRETELNDVYQILESMLSDFMRLESVSKLASLGDFMHRLEITVDQFGNVMKSRRVG